MIEMMKLARTFGRALDAELPSLTRDAVFAGEMLRRFLPTLKGESFHHPTTRADALRTLDEFARLRRTPGDENGQTTHFAELGTEETMWLKYSDEPILTGEYWDREQKRPEADGYRSDYEKPRGCWITDDTEHCWRDWCVGERFALEGLTHKHEVVLDESNILILRNSWELDEFTREYGGTCQWGPGGKYRNRYIDWQNVAARYDGLIITPYQWSQRMELNWYYTWDCASGCIWRAAAIREIRLIEIDNDVAKPCEKEAEAA